MAWGPSKGGVDQQSWPGGKVVTAHWLGLLGAGAGSTTGQFYQWLWNVLVVAA